MRQRNPKPHTSDGTGNNYYYNDIESNDYDDADLAPLLRVQTELLSSPPPLALSSSSRQLRNRDSFVDIPDVDYVASGTSHNHHHDMQHTRTSSSSLNNVQVNMSSNGHVTQKRKRSENGYDGNDDSSSNFYDGPVYDTKMNGNHVRNDKNIKKEIDKDDDYHFLMSMQPYMRQLRGDQKLRVRMKMQKLIFRELYEKCDGDSKEKTEFKETDKLVDVNRTHIKEDHYNEEMVVVKEEPETLSDSEI